MSIATHQTTQEPQAKDGNARVIVKLEVIDAISGLAMLPALRRLFELSLGRNLIISTMGVSREAVIAVMEVISAEDAAATVLSELQSMDLYTVAHVGIWAGNTIRAHHGSSDAFGDIDSFWSEIDTSLERCGAVLHAYSTAMKRGNNH